ncbi:hypothetical protein QP028_03020 [Corynebacterium suedekumii]|nr:hypothetical protein QP028_03020 [Corynebacterium suedekumii]
MKTTPDDPARTRRRLISFVCAGVAFLVLAAIGVYGLVTGPNETSPSPDGPPVPTRSTPDQSAPRLPYIAPSTDPEEFARSAAHALFTWDTTSGFLPLDHTAVLLDVGDPTGNEQAGLASDVTSYLPDRDAWVDLRQYSTSQHLAIADAYVPEQWAQAVEQARPGQLPVGATAITIEGTRHREADLERQTRDVRAPGGVHDLARLPTRRPADRQPEHDRRTGCRCGAVVLLAAPVDARPAAALRQRP